MPPSSTVAWRSLRSNAVEVAGSQGVEVVNWVAMRAAVGGDVDEVHRNYHIPISNTAAGLLAIEPSRSSCV